MSGLLAAAAWLADPGHWRGADGIGTRLAEHVWLSGAGLGIAVALALPVGLWLGHTGRGALLVISLANVGRALPSLALLALALPVAFWLGLGLGFWPTVLMLVPLGVPLILITSYTAVRSVDGEVVEVARGLGMRGWEVLQEVELPLAAPVILGGIGDAAVTIVATATLGALVASGGLGRYIVDGLARQETGRLVAGAVLVSLLAIGTEAAFGVLARALRGQAAAEDRIDWGGKGAGKMRAEDASGGAGVRGRAWRRALLLAALAAIALLTACGQGGGGGAAKPRVRIGSTNFVEQLVVAELYGQVLESNGYPVERKLNLGSREIVAPALESGQIDLYPEYLASCLAYFAKDPTRASSDAAATHGVLQEVLRPKGLRVLDYAPAVDTNGFVVTRETADRHRLARLSDLGAVAGRLVLGGPPECPDRPFCLPGLARVYGIRFKDFRALDAGGPLTVAALDGRQIEVALLFTTDAVIAAKGYVLLQDDRRLQLADNIAPLVREAFLHGAPADFARLINGVTAGITTAEITELNRRVGLDKQDPKAVAGAWLRQKGLVK